MVFAREASSLLVSSVAFWEMAVSQESAFVVDTASAENGRLAETDACLFCSFIKTKIGVSILRAQDR